MDIKALPGADIILQGVEDLQNGESQTIGALLIAIAATRLSNAGLTFPKTYLATDPELTLYHHLEDTREDAYPYYNALLASLNSFCNALEFRKRQKG